MFRPGWARDCCKVCINIFLIFVQAYEDVRPMQKYSCYYLKMMI